MSSRNTHSHSKMKTVHLLSVMTANKYHPYMKSESAILEPTLQKSNSQQNLDQTKTRSSLKVMQETTTKQINYLKHAQQENISSKDQLRTLSQSYFEPRNSSVTGGLTSRSNRSSIGSQQAILEYTGDSNIQAYQLSVSTAPEEPTEQLQKVPSLVISLIDCPEKEAYYRDEAIHAQYWISANRQIPQSSEQQQIPSRVQYSQSEIAQTIREDIQSNLNILRYSLLKQLSHQPTSNNQKQEQANTNFPNRQRQRQTYTSQQIQDVISFDQNFVKPFFQYQNQIQGLKSKQQGDSNIQYTAKEIQFAIQYDQETNHLVKYRQLTSKNHRNDQGEPIRQPIVKQFESTKAGMLIKDGNSNDHSIQINETQIAPEFIESDNLQLKTKKVQFLEDQPQEELLDQPIGIDLKSLMKARKQSPKNKSGKSQRTSKSMTSTRSYLSTHSLKEVAEDASLPLLSTTLVGSLGLYATQKILGSQKRLLGIIPGIAVGLATYYKIIQQRNREQQNLDVLSEDEFDDEEVNSQN